MAGSRLHHHSKNHLAIKGFFFFAKLCIYINFFCGTQKFDFWKKNFEMSLSQGTGGNSFCSFWKLPTYIWISKTIFLLFFNFLSKKVAKTFGGIFCPNPTQCPNSPHSMVYKHHMSKLLVWTFKLCPTRINSGFTSFLNGGAYL